MRALTCLEVGDCVESITTTDKIDCSESLEVIDMGVSQVLESEGEVRVGTTDDGVKSILGSSGISGSSKVNLTIRLKLLDVVGWSHSDLWLWLGYSGSWHNLVRNWNGLCVDWLLMFLQDDHFLTTDVNIGDDIEVDDGVLGGFQAADMVLPSIGAGEEVGSAVHIHLVDPVSQVHQGVHWVGEKNTVVVNWHDSWHHPHEWLLLHHFYINI